MRTLSILSVLLICSGWQLKAQLIFNILRGQVLEQGNDEEKIPLTGANVYWSGTNIGATSDSEGNFVISRMAGHTRLVVSYIGYQNDTIWVNEGTQWTEVILSSPQELSGAEIRHRRRTTEISRLEPIKIERISEQELMKAACCNLSESFETTPGVDVSFTDAVTGTRQINMLGLAGPYVLITRENIPDVRGLSAIYGLTYTPGPWVEGIQLNKGTGSVANGFESITGQINVELRKPEEHERLYLNLFANEEGRFEVNLSTMHRISDQWSTGLLLHGRINRMKMDKNDDGFLDIPIGETYIGLQRWNYSGDHGGHLQVGVKATYIDNLGGQVLFDPDLNRQNTTYWGMGMNTRRIEGWVKTGKIFDNALWRSAGLQVAGLAHQQEGYFGPRDYNADQQSFYANLLYQDIILNTYHKFRTGASFQYDGYTETFHDTLFRRAEAVPGVYAEYTWDYLEKFCLVAGIRADHHTAFGPFITPRLHFRWQAMNDLVVRLSAGRGQRTASVIAENQALMASSRTWYFQGTHSRYPYGLNPEIAWNYGLNLTQDFRLWTRRGTFTLDAYRTDFVSRVIVDLDQDPQSVLFYNLEGQSFSNSFQAQVDYELIEQFDFRLAYRLFDVRNTFRGQLMEQPLVSRHRAFVNMAYETINLWKFDFTANWTGAKRLPSTILNPDEYKLSEYSPSYFLLNGQISKSWQKRFDIYVGVENLLDYKQPNPILAATTPFNPWFDASMTWGPIFGRMVYAGIRYRFE